MEPIHSPLHDVHIGLGAKFSEFGGWSMPLEYADGGILAEHHAVRNAVGVFDVSHLGKVDVRGPGAVEYVNSRLTNDLGRIGTGEAQYTMLCADDGGVIDDLIAYRVNDFEVFLIPNAANASFVIAALREGVPEGIEVKDRHRDYAILAVQGPFSDETLGKIGLTMGHEYMAFTDDELDGSPVRVCRTGYTGERGYELIVSSEAAQRVWDRVFTAGRPRQIRACGLGARDTLRTEMGYALHGNELSRQISPVMARLGWAIGWDKPRYDGKEALDVQRAAKDGPLLRGLVAVGRGIPRRGMQVSVGAGPVGTVTTGTFSPTLRTGIALALLDRGVVEGESVSVDIRGRSAEFTVVKPPFVTPGVRED